MPWGRGSPPPRWGSTTAMSTGLARIVSTASGQLLADDPLKAVGVEGPESKNTLRWDGSQEQMSQNGPYLSQKGPKTGMPRVPDWRYPLTGTVT